MTIGIVATRGSVAEGQNSPGAVLYQCFATFARAPIASLRVVWSHWWGNAQSPTGDLTIVGAELEYPTGVYTPITFNAGSASIVTAPLTNVTSDPVLVNIPDGALFHVRALLNNPCNLTRGPDSTIGEGSVYPATGLTLVTARAAAFNANYTYSPSVIVGETARPNVMILGDSLASGLGDNYTRADGSYGTIGGALNAYGWAQMVQWGGSPGDYLAAAGPLQAELVHYASDVVSELGANHLFDGATAAATLADQAAIRALYPAQRFRLTSITPKATSSDLFETLPNQTPTANTPQIQLYNVAVLANAMGYAPPLNIAAVLEYQHTGKWQVNGTPNWLTVDGIHCTPFAYGLFPGAGFTLEEVSVANALYADGRQKILEGSIAWLTDNIKFALVRGYTPDLAANTFLSDVTGAGGGVIVATSPNASGKSATNGVADCNDPVFAAVAAGAACQTVVFYKDTGVAGTSPLLGLIDTATGLPVTPNGQNVTVQIDSGPNKLFKL